MSTLFQRLIDILDSYDTNDDGVIDGNVELLEADLIDAAKTVPEEGPIIVTETDAGG
jgi:hypothetical protein